MLHGLEILNSDVQFVNSSKMPRDQFTLPGMGKTNSYKAIKRLHEQIVEISNGHPAELLAGYLSHTEGKKIAHKLPALMQQGILKTIVKSIVTRHKEAALHEKRQWLSLVADHFTASELREHGFQFTDEALATARRHAANHGAGAAPAAPIQPLSKRATSPEKIEEIASFLSREDNSHPAANRTVIEVFSFFPLFPLSSFSLSNLSFHREMKGETKSLSQ